MKYRIKSPKQGYSRSGSPESAVNWAAKCVLDEQVSTELSDVVDPGHVFGPEKEKEGDIQVMPILSFASYFLTWRE